MFVIQGTTVQQEIADMKFACDLNACKGACCTLPGGKGAPLLDEETNEIERAFPIVRKYLSVDHLRAIDQDGMYDGTPGDYTTPCVDHRACVFVMFEEGIAKCSFEKAFHNGEIGWRKPLSCHLFPVRVDRGFEDRLRFEYISECRPALARGNRQNIWLSDFLQTSLTRAYGDKWYDEFKHNCYDERK